jgi:hypothetical protein
MYLAIMPLAAPIPPIYPLAPGGTNSPYILLCPWRHKFPLYTIMPLAAQFPQYLLPFFQR